MKHSESEASLKREIDVLYKHFREVKGLLKSLGCDAVTAEDLFQEAIIIYLRRKETPDFQFTVEPIHYIKQTCKFLWYAETRKQAKQDGMRLEEAPEEDEWMEKELKFKSLEHAISRIDEKCRELLQLFYGLGWNMVDIAKKLGLRNDKVAKAQKYRCIQKAKELVLEIKVDFENLSPPENPQSNVESIQF
jgi:RNA polymerase sigma factor (sigma-70 family)